jgi:hypothetical protein
MSPARKKGGQKKEYKNNDWHKDSHLASSFPVFVVALPRAERKKKGAFLLSTHTHVSQLSL